MMRVVMCWLMGHDWQIVAQSMDSVVERCDRCHAERYRVLGDEE
jgi:hypothetical protein